MNRFVIVGAGNLDVIALYRAGLGQIEALALRHSLDYVNENDVGEFLAGDLECATGSNVASSDDCNFLSHISPQKGAVSNCMNVP